MLLIIFFWHIAAAFGAFSGLEQIEGQGTKTETFMFFCFFLWATNLDSVKYKLACSKQGDACLSSKRNNSFAKMKHGVMLPHQSSRGFFYYWNPFTFTFTKNWAWSLWTERSREAHIDFGPLNEFCRPVLPTPVLRLPLRSKGWGAADSPRPRVSTSELCRAQRSRLTSCLSSYWFFNVLFCFFGQNFT